MQVGQTHSVVRIGGIRRVDDGRGDGESIQVGGRKPIGAIGDVETTRVNRVQRGEDERESKYSDKQSEEDPTPPQRQNVRICIPAPRVDGFDTLNSNDSIALVVLARLRICV